MMEEESKDPPTFGEATPYFGEEALSQAFYKVSRVSNSGMQEAKPTLNAVQANQQTGNASSSSPEDQQSDRQFAADFFVNHNEWLSQRRDTYCTVHFVDEAFEKARAASFDRIH